MSKLPAILTESETADVRLEARELCMGYGDAKVLEGLDLQLPRGKITAIVGPNGCGKSTLLSGLARLHKPSGGAVLLNGKVITELPTREVARQLALLPQEATPPDGLTVAELIRFGRQPHQRLFQQWSDHDQAIIDAALQAADLVELADRPLQSMS